MKTKIVNGHVLPLELVLMTESGRWGPLNRKMDISALPIEDKEDLILLDVPEMIRNTEELRASIARGDGALFALMDGCVSVPGFLDVNQAVVIAATYGQEALAIVSHITPYIISHYNVLCNKKWLKFPQG